MSDLNRYAVTASVMAVSAVAAAVVWVEWASPALWEVREQGLVLTEAASRGQFSVIATFSIVGAVASLLSGFFAERRHPDIGWSIVAFVAVVAALGAVLTWQLGLAWGPPDPATVEGLAVGDLLPAQLKIDAAAAFVVWPLFAVIGAMTSTWLRSGHDVEPVSFE